MMAVFICTEDADARLENEFGIGGTGVRFTVTMPVMAPAPRVLVALDHPAGMPQSGTLGGLFNRGGILGGFAAGFLGAGLLGLLFGHGLFGELGGVASFFGLAFQLALVVLLIRLIWSWWNGHNQPAFAGMSPRQLADPYLRPSLHEPPPGSEPEPPKEPVTEPASAPRDRDT